MKVLVTGSEGMIGTAVVEVLQDDGNAEDTANETLLKV
jgi:nucleoside-diphosphate-sugar epimerase